MSVSGLHHHFKAVTAMSPLQFQKQLRLQEARRLMLGEDLDAASAAYRVGYNDASHFNREYKSLFGIPPCATTPPGRGADEKTVGTAPCRLWEANPQTTVPVYLRIRFALAHKLTGTEPLSLQMA